MAFRIGTTSEVTRYGWTGTIDENGASTFGHIWEDEEVDSSCTGSIGAFYFGSEFTNALLGSLDIPTFEIKVCDFTQDAIIENIFPAVFDMVVPQVSAYTLSPFDFDFSATPLAGSSPLKVKFTAYNYEPRDQYANTWEADTFNWYFDYGSYPNQVTITKTDTTTYMYCYPSNSRKFDVRLCVKYKIKNR